jgi:hypothetical protein
MEDAASFTFRKVGGTRSKYMKEIIMRIYEPAGHWIASKRGRNNLCFGFNSSCSIDR